MQDWTSQRSVREEIQAYETLSFPAVLYAIAINRGGRKGGGGRERRKVMKTEGGLVENRGRRTRENNKVEGDYDQNTSCRCMKIA